MNAFIIDQEKLIGNIESVKQHAKGKRIFAVVKGDGYGFGIVPFVKFLCENGINSFAVTEPEEVAAIRGCGLKEEDILMLRSTALEDEIEELIQARAILTIGSNEAAVAVNGIAGRLGVRARVHIKIDTGMGRYGFEPNELEKIFGVYSYMPNVEICGVYTHLNCAFGKRKKTLSQIAQFQTLVQRIRNEGFDPGEVHFANSSAVYKFTNLDFGDAVRVGSAFTGRLAFACKNSGLTRVGYLESRVCEIRWLSRGATVGYGAAYRARSPRKIAIIPLGYSHGFATEKIRDSYRFRDGILFVLQDIKRVLTHEKLYVDVGGKQVSVLGHVGMLHTVVDITDISCNIGDRAIFTVSPLYVNANVERKYI